MNRLLQINVTLFAALAILASIAAPAALADAATDQGLAIAREQDRRESGFGDYSALFSMTLVATDVASMKDTG